MPFYLTSQTLKQQAKIIVKNWVYESIKTSQARDLLCQLYGYKNNHHYKTLLNKKEVKFSSIDKNVFTTHYKNWVQRLASLANINETQAQKLLNLLWKDYIKENSNIENLLYASSFKFHGSTLDFLDDRFQNEAFAYNFNDNPSIKDAIEAIGVPHVEVGAIVVNGHNRYFDYQLQENDKVEVYPHNFSNTQSYLPFKPQKELSFLLDVHLGTLARYLRMAGFDTLYESKDYGDAFLAGFSSTHQHIMLSRDIGLLKRGTLEFGHWVRNTDPMEQFKEIVKLYGLQEHFKPMGRCIVCNEKINPVNKTDIKEFVPLKVYEWKEEFFQCSGCSKVYWEGSHHKKMMEQLQEVLDA